MELDVRLVVTIVTILIILSTGTIIVFFTEDPDMEIYQETKLDIRISVMIRNLGQAQAINIPLRLAIPIDNQPVQKVQRILLSEDPIRWTNDTWGNRFIHYNIPILNPAEIKNFTLDITLKLFSIDFNIQKSKIGNYDQNFSRYLLESYLININDPKIIELANKIAKDSENIVDIAWNAYEWIINNIYYQQIAGELDAQTTLRNGEGGSAELANLFVTLMRANGIPSRRISGWAQNFDKGDHLFLSRFSHGWAEIYLPNYGWLPVDPTWGKAHKFENFAKSQNTHIILIKGAGIHYLSRGPYAEPYGQTEVDTDYILEIIDKSVKNLSVQRDIITYGILFPPIFFAIFILIKRFHQRRTLN